MVEGRLLNQYRDLDFYDPDDEVTRTVYSRNLTCVKNCVGKRVGRVDGFFSVHNPDDDNNNNIQSFIISDFVVDLIADTQQTAGVQVVQLVDDSGVKKGNGEDTGDVGIGGETDMV